MSSLKKEIRRIIKEELASREQKPKLFFLVGPPAVGKSTWIQNNADIIGDAVIVNRDEMVEQVASSTSIGTYDEMYVKAPSDIVPTGMPTKEEMMDPASEGAVDAYLELLDSAAMSFNANPQNSELVEKYGRLLPFDKNSLYMVIVKFGVPTRFIIPFEYSKIKAANDKVAAMFDLTRKEAATSGRAIVFDMVNMTIQERNNHRKYLVAAIEGIEERAADPNDINKYYDQIAVVFAPEQGYTDEVRDQIKRVAAARAEEIKLAGRSKTIPGAAYDRWFSSYTPPSPDEGFVQIIPAGVPSLGLNERILRKFIRTLV